MEESTDYLLLKWGTLKGWSFHDSPKAFDALKAYNKLGSSLSAMQQRDTEEQKELICTMIDEVKGPVTNDWTGEEYENLEDAKKYVREYRTS